MPIKYVYTYPLIPINIIKIIKGKGVELTITHILLYDRKLS